MNNMYFGREQICFQFEERGAESSIKYALWLKKN